MRLLDLFCGAGGASEGYRRAGFEVVGVDIEAQRHYPFEFHRADALEYPLEGFDVIHASPPCQAYSKAQRLNGRDHPRLIEPIRDRLKATGLPYVIENVVGAPLENPVMLCGTMFGLKTERCRLFEMNVPLPLILDYQRTEKMAKMGRAADDDEFIHICGHFPDPPRARTVMGIDWPMTRAELAEAIPPAYTEWVGRYILGVLALR